MSEYTVINSRAARVDTPDKATGKAVFIDDMTLPGMLYGALLQSPLAHARIVSIDTSKAQEPAGRQIRCHRGGSRPGQIRRQSRQIRRDAFLPRKSPLCRG